MSRVFVLPILLASSLLNTRANAGPASFGGEHKIEFGKSTPADVRFSPQWIHAEAGVMVSTNRLRAEKPLWIETGKLPIGVRLAPSSVQIEVAVKGKMLIHGPFPRNCFVRYSIDGSHWTSWQALIKMEEGRNLKKGETPLFHGLVAAPFSEREKYLQYDWKWQRAVPDYSADKRELAKWIRERDPNFFKKYIPFVGFIELRLEDPHPLQQPVTINEVLVRFNYSISGFQKLFR